jgi:hypothetical protein
MREDPIFSGGWIKATLVILVAGALGIGAYLLASGVDINLPDLNTGTNGTQTTLSDTTLEDTTIGQPKPVTTGPTPKAPKPAPATPGIQELQQLNSCIQAAGNDIDKITVCFDRFNR